MPNTAPRQTGFTIIELMVAMTVGLLLLTILGGIYLDAARTVDTLVQRMAMNRQAREMFDILANGGANLTDGINTTTANTITDATRDNHNYIFGIRGRLETAAKNGWKLPASILATDGALAYSSLYRLGLSPTNDAPDAVKKPLLSSEGTKAADTSGVMQDGVAVTCTALDDPLEGCSAAGEQRLIRGFLRGDVDFTNTVDALAGSRRGLLMLVNPYTYNLSKNRNRAGLTDTDVYDVYWTAFRPAVEAIP